jgi:hypothetical protein
MNTHRRLVLAAASAVAALALGVTTAVADKIDGEWCHLSSSLKIEGPQVRTPGGASIVGDYTRHGFSYTVPANEAGAGTLVVMVLRGEELMELTRASAATAAPERWVRCRPIS